MKVVRIDSEDVSAFTEELTNNRPAILVTVNQDGDPVLTLGRCSWREMAYIKMCLDMHLAADWGSQ